MTSGAKPFSARLARFLRDLSGWRDMTYEEMAQRAAHFPEAPTAAEIAALLGRELAGKCILNRLGRDREVAEWIARHAPHMTLDELHAGVVERFGPARAPSRNSIHRHLSKGRASGPPRRKARIERDPEVAAAVLELAGTLPVPAIRAELSGRFTPDRVPPRSTLYRHVSSIIGGTYWKPS